jgi:hypothetical protein
MRTLLHVHVGEQHDEQKAKVPKTSVEISWWDSMKRVDVGQEWQEAG